MFIIWRCLCGYLNINGSTEYWTGSISTYGLPSFAPNSPKLVFFFFSQSLKILTTSHYVITVISMLHFLFTCLSQFSRLFRYFLFIYFFFFFFDSLLLLLYSPARGEKEFIKFASEEQSNSSNEVVIVSYIFVVVVWVLTKFYMQRK